MDGEVKHHYNELQKQAENIKSLASQFIFLQNQSIHFPRYLNRLKASHNYLDGEKNDYNVLTNAPESLRDNVHPVYVSENPGHTFNDVPPKVSGPKNVAGPVYLTKNARHKYAEFI